MDYAIVSLVSMVVGAVAMFALKGSLLSALEKLLVRIK